MHSPKTGILLLNTGTPKKADKTHVGRYLRQFLMDPRVIDLPWYIRWPLVNGLVIPARLKTSTEAYRMIWTEKGSPLLANSVILKEKLSALYPEYTIALGMRYGEPSVADAIEALQKAGCERWIIMPLFPQYASASTGSVLALFLAIIAQFNNIPPFRIVPSFYDHPAFIQAYANNIQPVLPTSMSEEDFVLFSYHGLPERHIGKSGCKTVCYTQKDYPDCPAISIKNAYCYRAQCYATSRLLAEQLQLKSKQYATVFQSRLGKTPWIKPYNDEYLAVLIQKGIKNLAIACPSFVIDCLETLEEIAIRLKAQWEKCGGVGFTMVPCLNDDASWIAEIIDQHSFGE